MVVLVRNHDAAAATEQHLNKLRRAYRRTFGEGVGKTIVLPDLARFGWAMHSTWAEGDPYESARRDGQRSVILRIFELLNMSTDDVTRLAYGQIPEQQQDITG